MVILHICHLVRLKSGGFSLNQSITLDNLREIVEQDRLQEVLLPLEYGLNGLQKIIVKILVLLRIQNGQKIMKTD